MSLDDFDLFTDPDWPPPVEREPRPCRHPRDARTTSETGWECRCGHKVARADVRRGKSARRLGGDQERRIERVYGPVKIGERGDPVDHLGKVWRWQSKATRDVPPLWLAKIDRPTRRETLPAAIEGPWNRMAGHYGERPSVVIRSYVSRGVRSRDWMFVWWRDARDELGLEPVPGLFWWVIPGDWWLDRFGRDE